MSDWFTILKGVKQISSTGIKTKIGTRPLTISDDEDCCQQMKDFFIANIDYLDNETFGVTGNWDFISDMDCETFIENSKKQYNGMRIVDIYSSRMKEVWNDSLLIYKWCNEG